MKNLMFMILIFCSVGVQAQSGTPEQLVKDFFEAFHAQDTIQLKKYGVDSLELRSISQNAQRNTLINTSTFLEFRKGIAAIPKEATFKEIIHEYRVEENGLLATVTTPYTFYYNGQKSHCGTNIFNLVKINEQWKILFLMDSRHKENCN